MPPTSGTYQLRRTGGTNVDPESARSDSSGGDDYVNDWRGTVHPGPRSVRSGGRTAASDWDVSRGSVASDQNSVERMTVGGATSIWTTRGVESDMLAMRERLQADADAAEDLHDREMRDHVLKTSKLSSTVHRLQDAETQLRHLQATLIAERVGRTEAEKQSEMKRDEIRKFKGELAGAVRALRRAREEAKRGEEERRRVLRGWEEAKERLHRYHEELKVRDARAKGKEEGRQEAFIEIERWMTAPPIPVEPVTDPASIVQASPHNRLHQLDPGQAQHEMQPPSRQRTPGLQQGLEQRERTPHQTPLQHPQMQQQPQPQSQQQHYQMQHQQQQQYQQPLPVHHASPAPTAPHAHAHAHNHTHRQGGTPPDMNHPRQEHGSRLGHTAYGSPPGTHRTQATALPTAEPHVYTAADSYLEHVEHDPHLREMLHGAPTRTFHTSFGLTEGSRTGDGGHSRSHSHSQSMRPQTDFDGMDKPLPEPREGSVPMPLLMGHPHQQQHHGGDIHRAQSTARERSHHPGSARGHSHLKHSRSTSQIPDGDRYPVFPRPGRGHGHSRQSSRDQTFPPFPPQPPSTAQHQHRSRLAGGLRNDEDLDEPDLGRIEEEPPSHGHPRRAGTTYEAPLHSNESQRHHRARSQQSMPSLRQRPVPKMPAPLSQHPREREMEEREPERRSFLGLSGLTSRQQPHGPSITVQPPSRSSHRPFQPPVSHQQTSAMQQAGPAKSHQPPSTAPPTGPAQHTPSTNGQTVIVTERFDPPTPHDIPLPHSRTTTLYSAAPQPRGISIIDYALQRPLPASRPQTVVSAGRAATVETETDAEAPRASRPSRRGPRSVKSGSRRAKPSTYAGTVATIEEITEEESGRDTRR